MPVLRNALSPGRRSEGRTLSGASTHAGPPSVAGRHAGDDRVLLISPSWVGDAILSEPLIATLRRNGVTKAIDVVAPSWCGPVYARMRGVGRILDAPAAHGEFALRARYAFELAPREHRYTHAYVLPNT